MQNKARFIFGRKIKIVFVFFAALVLSFVIGTNVVKADGGIFYPVNRYTSEIAQKAFIYYQNQTENLVISTSYQGNAKDFAWVIPTPGKPEIFKSDSKIFATLDDITKINGTGPGVVYNQSMLLGSSSVPSAVNVIEQKTVDIYDTTILQATDGTVLVKWLNGHGYTFPVNKSDMLQSYINNGWYFTVAKIQNTLINNTDVTKNLATGDITPLRLSFTTNKIIYPMKLTRLALDFVESDSARGGLNNSGSTNMVPPQSYYKSSIPITLYVLAGGKTVQNLLPTSWANWVSPTEILSLNNSIMGENWINPGSNLFLTKMEDSVDIKNVNDDFIITKASDNKIYPLPAYKTADFWLANIAAFFITVLAALFSPIGLIFIIILLLQVFVIKRRWVYILGSIYEVLVCLASPIVWLIGYASANSSTPFFLDGFAGFSLALLLVFAATVCFTLKMIKRYRNKKCLKMFRV